MLSDRERQALDELQRRLVAEDPRFAASFTGAGPGASSFSVRWAYVLPSWAYPTAMTVAATLGVLMLVVGAPGSALVLAAPATGISLLRRRRTEAAQRDS